MGFWAELGGNVLLFCLVLGMSATVELKSVRKQINNSTALLIGVSMQFLILPFIGFLVVKALNLPAAMGITLLVVTSSPGGSYSNWWCSLFNAELSLSVTMTAISTLLSTIMLPTNLILYARWTYSSAVVKSLDWNALFVSLVVVLSGISCGLFASARAKKLGISSWFHRRANLLGNFAGISLITLSVSVSSSDHKVSLWDQDPLFYIGVALPACLGLAIATHLATRMQLQKPERVAVAVESCYQNTGIATSVALTMFSDNEDELATAIGVPLLYGMCEAIMLALFCLVCWKIGWTKAPAQENLCVVLYNSYEVDEEDQEEMEEAIEVVLGCGDVGPDGAGSSDSAQPPSDLIFAQTEGGSYAVDKLTLDKANSQNQNPRGGGPTKVDEDDDDDHTDGDMTDVSLDVHHVHHHPTTTTVAAASGGLSSIQEPSSSSQQSGSSSSHDVEEQRANSAPQEQDAAAMILAMEDEDRKVRLRGGTTAANSGAAATTGRLGRTISTIRARATGYVKAPLPTSPDSVEEDPGVVAPEADAVVTATPDGTVAVAIVDRDTRRLPRRVAASPEEGRDDEHHHHVDHDDVDGHNGQLQTPARKMPQKKSKDYHAIPAASPDMAGSSLRKNILPAEGKQLD